MTHTYELTDSFIERRNKGLRELDIDFMRTMLPWAGDDQTLLAALHKARYEVPEIEDHLRYESAAWLAARQMIRIGGRSLLPAGQLPVSEGI